MDYVFFFFNVPHVLFLRLEAVLLIFNFIFTAYYDCFVTIFESALKYLASTTFITFN